MHGFAIIALEGIPPVIVMITTYFGHHQSYKPYSLTNQFQ